MDRKTMVAVLTTGNGGIELRRITLPQPGPEKVLIKVVVAAQNPTDCTCIRGCGFKALV